MKHNILITGASGFIGQHLYRSLLNKGYEVRSVVRHQTEGHNTTVVIDDITATTDWLSVLQGIDIVVHLAAQTHTPDNTPTLTQELHQVNVAGTLNLARQAAETGVNQFIFLSSIKVNSEETAFNHSFSENSLPDPQDSYAQSKWQAEQGLRQIQQETDLKITVIRPPMVYGPGAKGNFATMVNCINKGIPLPLGAIHNKRSLVGIDNLVDFIVTCMDHPAAANQTFLVSDGEDLSTTELLRRIGHALGKPACLLPLPVKVLQFGARLTGTKSLAQKLCGNLQVDSSKARSQLGWQPEVTVTEGLKRAIDKSASPLKTPSHFKLMRLFDILLSLTGLILTLPIMGLIAIFGLFDTGSPLFLQERVGKNQQPFILLKFRTMRRDTPSIASHLADSSAITIFGRFLRNSKLDELPQLWNVLIGDMSLVGPRPCLFSQKELIAARKELGVFVARPGITGLAQINNIDMSTPRKLAETDARMINGLTLSRYFHYIIQTLKGKGTGDRVR